MFSLLSALKPTVKTAWKIQPGKVILLCLLLFGLVVWTFLPTLRGDFIDIDDGVFIIRNTHINLTLANVAWAFCNTTAANWIPLTACSFLLDHQLYGLKPWGYHLTNVLLHAFNTVLVFFVLRRMTGATWRSLAAAVLFGLHPLRVESVAWISERKDVLSVAFWMLTLWAYTRYAHSLLRVTPSSLCSTAPEIRESRAQAIPALVPRPLIPYYGLSLFFFALSLVSKPMVVTLPFVLLLLDFWPLERWKQKKLRVLLVEKVPFFLLSAIVSVVTYVAQRTAGMMSTSMTGLSLSFGARLENALISYVRYLGKLFWPVDLCALYPYPDRWPTQKIFFAGLLVLSLSILVFAARRRWPFLLTGWLWYLGTLVPVLGLVSVGPQAMADRYSYIPSIGILIIVVWGACQMTSGWRCQSTGLGAVGGVLALVCIGLTRHQIGYWEDGISLWRRAVTVTGKNFEAHNWLGCALTSQKRYDEAIPEFQEAARLNTAFAEPYNSLGHIAAWLGRVSEAIVYYQRALAIRPEYVAVYNCSGELLRQEGRLDEAINYFQKAVECEPNIAINQNNLGYALSMKGRSDEALAHFQKAVALEPDNEIFQYNFGSFLLQRGRVDEAIGHFRSALKLQPDDAKIHNDLGRALLSMQQPDEAIRELQTAARLKPDQAEAHSDLGFALSKLGRLDEAIHEFQTAARLNPGQAETHANLGYAFVKQGRLDEANREFQEAVRLKPDLAEAHSDLGFVLTQQRRLDEAIHEFQDALKLRPGDLDASNDLVIAVGMKEKQLHPPNRSMKP